MDKITIKDILIGIIPFLVIGGMIYACSDKNDKKTEVKQTIKKEIFESDTILKYLFVDENNVWHSNTRCPMLDGESAYSYRLNIEYFDFKTWDDIIWFISSRQVCSCCFRNHKLEDIKSHFDSINNNQNKAHKAEPFHLPFGGL